MKKKFLSLLMLSIAVAVMGLTFIACGDDNDEPTPDPTPAPSHPAKIGIGYSLDLGDGWWDFFDIEVTYTTADGGSETKTVHKGWVYAGKVNYADAVNDYTFTAKATPKATQPEIDPDKQYDFNSKAQSYAFGLNANDEQTEVLATKSNVISMTIAGSNLSKWMGEHKNLGAGTMSIDD